VEQVVGLVIVHMIILVGLRRSPVNRQMVVVVVVEFFKYIKFKVKKET
jgi:hypothetical protein